MKSSTLSFVILFILSSASLLNGQSIQQRTEAANFIFEGQVISSTGFWDDNHTQIFTSNLVEVFKIFKGKGLPDTIEVITKGGVVGNAFLDISHTVRLTTDMEDLFFCTSINKKLPEDKYPKCEILSGENAFIQYHAQIFNPPASDYEQTYQNIQREIYRAVELVSKQPTRVIPSNTQENRNLGFAEWNTLAESSEEITIEYSFENVQIISLTEIQFDIYAKVNEAGNGMKFGEAEIYVEYNPDVFGSNIVGNNMIEVSKGTVIQNEIYGLSTTDADEKTIKILLEGGCQYKREAFELSTTAQQLCRVNLTVHDLSQLANIAYDDFRMDGKSRYISPLTRDCYDFDKIIVDNPIKHFQSEDPVGITYALENFEVTGAGSSMSLEFDVYASAATGGTDYAQGSIYINYSNLAFGNSIFGQSDLLFTKGTLLQNASYALTASDDDFNTFKLSITGTNPNDLATLPTTPIQVVHVRMIGQNCNQEAGLSFDQPLMATEQFHHVGGVFPLEMYEPVTAATTYNQPACSDDIPIILGFTPTVVAAGVGDTITIIGRNFRNIEGKVSFRNADKASEVYTTALGVDVVVWKDTIIKVHVPSITADNGTAGTGKIIVQNVDGFSRQSDSILTVKYAVRNTVFTNQYPYRANLIDQNGEGGYTFFVDSFLFSQPNALPCIEKALMDWSCATGVTWKIGGVTASNFASATDNKNVIFWSGLPDSTLALTYVAGERITDCSNSLGNDILFAKDIDIEINSTQLWSWDCNNPPLYTDFYTVILHELGHARMLGHALPLPKSMYPVIGSSERRLLEGTDIEGGRDVMAYGEDNLSGSCPAYNDPDIPDGCKNPVFEANSLLQGQVNIYPNPFTEAITLETDFSESSTVHIYGCDVLGRQIYQASFQVPSGQGNKVPLSMEKDWSAGVYYFEIRVDGARLTKKLVKL